MVCHFNICVLHNQTVARCARPAGRCIESILTLGFRNGLLWVSMIMIAACFLHMGLLTFWMYTLCFMVGPYFDFAQLDMVTTWTTSPWRLSERKLAFRFQKLLAGNIGPLPLNIAVGVRTKHANMKSVVLSNSRASRVPPLSSCRAHIGP